MYECMRQCNLYMPASANEAETSVRDSAATQGQESHGTSGPVAAKQKRVYNLAQPSMAKKVSVPASQCRPSGNECTRQCSHPCHRGSKYYLDSAIQAEKSVRNSAANHGQESHITSGAMPITRRGFYKIVQPPIAKRVTVLAGQCQQGTDECARQWRHILPRESLYYLASDN